MATISDRLRSAALLAAVFGAASCGAAGPSPETTRIDVPPPDGIVAEGGYSDLALDPSDPSGRTVLAISDRGPNAPRKGDVVFPHRLYHQKITRFRLEPDGSIRRLGMDSLRDDRGAWTTGLPSPFFPTLERAFATGPDGNPVPLPPDSAGFDFEGLAAADSNGLWASEEYGPRIVRLLRDAPGSWRIGQILSPGGGLPAVFARRAPNKGLEALCALPSGALVAIFQGPLANAAAGDPDDVAERSLARRLLVVDPTAGASRELVAEMDDPPGEAKRRTKIGACAALAEDRILVVEHRKAGKKRGSEIDLVEWNLAKATDISRPGDSAGRGRLVDGRTLEEVALVPGALAAAGIRPVQRRIARHDLSRGVPRPEELTKPEGLVLLPGKAPLLVFDNDFGVAEALRSSAFLRAERLDSLP